MATLGGTSLAYLGWIEAGSGRETDAFGGKFQPRAGDESGGVRILEGRSPAYERSNGHFPAHVLTVNRGPAVPFEASWDGRIAAGSSESRQVNVWPAGMAHSVRWLRPGDWWVVQLDPGLLERVAASIGLPRAPEVRPAVAVADPVASHLVAALALEVAERDACGGLVRESLGLALAGHLLHAHSAWPAAHRSRPEAIGGTGRSRMDEVVRYIEERLDDDLSLHDLAAFAAMEPFPFLRAFRRFTGASPHRYVIRARVERAKVLLRDGALSISDVALRTGFATPSHFSSTFRRIAGCTPRAWRAGAA
ncbi:MAG TPA: AraC family transcriptional regulator [Anaeromyxobacteraceae bacterium]|nr:AraC family transcriptional regulator [Anaeromyxobacteraceae bacterium]